MHSGIVRADAEFEFVTRAGCSGHHLLVLAHPTWRPRRTKIPIYQAGEQNATYDCQLCTIGVALTHVHVHAGRFTPWQLIVSTLTGVYAVRNLDKILGLAGRCTALVFAVLHAHIHISAPEPLANLVRLNVLTGTRCN